MQFATIMASKGEDLKKKIYMAAGAIMGLMLLFPPKVITMTLLGATETKSAGFVFLFSDPATSPFGPNPLVTSSIAWFQLLVQWLVVAGIAYGAARFLENQKSATSPGTSL